MQQSMHELLPEMAWQVGVLKRLDRIIELLGSIEAGLSIKLEVPVDVDPAIFDDIIDWESTDVTDYVSMQ